MHTGSLVLLMNNFHPYYYAEEMCGVAHCASCGEGPLQCTECSQSPFSYMLTDNQRCNRKKQTNILASTNTTNI